MREANLPSPGTGSNGYHMRRVAAKSISDMERVAPKYTSGYHPQGAKLRDFFLACAAAVSKVVTGLWPLNTVAPAVTGTAQVGQVLTTTNGTWTGTATIAFTRRWLADGVVIAGATGLTYTLLVGQLGKVIRSEVTGTNSHGAVVALSNSTVAVIA